MTRRLAAFVPRPIDDDTLARQWTGVQRGLVRRRRRRLAAATSALLSIVCLVGWLARPRPLPVSLPLPAPTASAATTTAEATHVALPDGSRLVLEAGARARVASVGREDVRVVLEGGRVEITASHDPERRRFVLAAGELEVRVVGTVFWVARDAGHVEVGVREGRVEVRLREALLGEVGAGEQRVWDDPPSPAAPPAPEEPRSAAVVDAGAPPPRAKAADRPPPAAPRGDDGAALFAAAQEARTGGRNAEAARLFDTLRRTRRDDGHAALAAFELGRLRLDALGDPAGAAEAFADALTLGPGSALAEDAEGRRVEALGKSGQTERCAAAREAYLVHYPRGVYVRSVAAVCR